MPLQRQLQTDTKQPAASFRLDFRVHFAYSDEGMATSLRSIPQSFSRYLVAGGAAFCLDYALFCLCYSCLGLFYAAAAAVGFCGGVICTYICCNLWVFSHRKLKEQRVREFCIFVFIGLIGLALTLLFMGFWVDVAGLHPYISKIITTGMVLIWNFTARKIALY